MWTFKPINFKITVLLIKSNTVYLTLPTNFSINRQSIKNNEIIRYSLSQNNCFSSQNSINKMYFCIKTHWKISKKIGEIFFHSKISTKSTMKPSTYLYADEISMFPTISRKNCVYETLAILIQNVFCLLTFFALSFRKTTECFYFGVFLYFVTLFFLPHTVKIWCADVFD